MSNEQLDDYISNGELYNIDSSVSVLVMCNSGDISIYRDMKFHIVI